METRRSDKDAAPPASPRQPYRLTPAGLASLRASAQRHRPWRASTGPRTAEQKQRARMNALRHGERSAATREALHDVRALPRLLGDGCAA